MQSSLNVNDDRIVPQEFNTIGDSVNDDGINETLDDGNKKIGKILTLHNKRIKLLQKVIETRKQQSEMIHQVGRNEIINNDPSLTGAQSKYLVGINESSIKSTEDEGIEEKFTIQDFIDIIKYLKHFPPEFTYRVLNCDNFLNIITDKGEGEDVLRLLNEFPSIKTLYKDLMEKCPKGQHNKADSTEYWKISKLFHTIMKIFNEISDMKNEKVVSVFLGWLESLHHEEIMLLSNNSQVFPQLIKGGYGKDAINLLKKVPDIREIGDKVLKKLFDSNDNSILEVFIDWFKNGNEDNIYYVARETDKFEHLIDNGHGLEVIKILKLATDIRRIDTKVLNKLKESHDDDINNEIKKLFGKWNPILKLKYT